jgi:hypothetical protein
MAQIQENTTVISLMVKGTERIYGSNEKSMKAERSSEAW